MITYIILALMQTVHDGEFAFDGLFNASLVG